ncbi:SLAP domain-containing protein [Clostridium sp. P21]|uniref:SLAP domain-containing protein n=1 Tax=Clostridium muellerianum TaxID=2716538 RepID=A0A7Y0EKC2_9CLOT|nr:SLAP domain-containing protein [Clostridium muellerianum]NMM65063.1 SLAP domain-containing protein [Clostridium muellerianum]
MSEEKQNVKIELSLPERFEAIVSDVQKDIMNEEISGFEPIKENDINISTVYTFDDGDEIEAKVYFRNGLPTNINFEYVSLVMINSKKEIVASKRFDLREMGDIPTGGARPWKLYFEKSCVDMKKFSTQDCKILFEKNIKAVNYAKFEFENFPEEFQNFKGEFDKFLEDLPKIEGGNLSISTFSINVQKNNNIVVTIVIRNSIKRSVKIEQIPITIRDENDNILVNGNFNLNNFVVSPMKARMCNLAFETNLSADEVMKKDKWKVVYE